MSVILLVDGLLLNYSGTAGGGQVSSDLFSILRFCLSDRPANRPIRAEGESDRLQPTYAHGGQCGEDDGNHYYPHHP